MTRIYPKVDIFAGYEHETDCGQRSDASLRMVKRVIFTGNQKPSLSKTLRIITQDANAVDTNTYTIYGDSTRHGAVSRYSNGTRLTVWDRKSSNGVIQKATCIEKNGVRYIDFESDGKIDCMETVVSYSQIYQK